MKSDSKFAALKMVLRSSTLFACCALLPVGAATVLSLHDFTEQLSEQTQRRLQWANQALSNGIHERLLLVEAEMRIVASNLGAGSGIATRSPTGLFDDGLKQRCNSLVLVMDAKVSRVFFGRIDSESLPTPEEMNEISGGKTILYSRHDLSLPSRLFMMMSLEPQQPRKGVLLTEIETSRLWSIGHKTTLPPRTDLFVMDHTNNVLLNSLPEDVALLTQAAAETDGSKSFQFESKQANKEYLASCWTIFLKDTFSTPKWTLVMSQPKSDVLPSIVKWKKTFSIAFLVSFLAVFFLSNTSERISLHRKAED